MCELFGVSSVSKIPVNSLLERLQSHSAEHPHGWGMAVFYGNSVSLEKEPKPAYMSDYLTSRLSHPFETGSMIAHIRLATRGGLSFENSHPFVKRDAAGRAWTLAHNGTIFYSPLLDEYTGVQEGNTDSERILCHIIRRMDEEIQKRGSDLEEALRFEIMDRIIHEIAPHNKLNLLVYDGELLYVHTNMAGTLYVKQAENTAVFATSPLDDGCWRQMDMMKLQAYHEGRLVYEGKRHFSEYKADTKVNDLGMSAGL